MGESAKRKDPDADTIQSSKDDEELLITFARQACNELVTAVALRFPLITYSVDSENISLEFETMDAKRLYLLPMLKQSITDYLTNEVTMHWLLTRQPQMAQSCIALRNKLHDNVQFLFAKFYNTVKTRRRSTDLAGI